MRYKVYRFSSEILLQTLKQDNVIEKAKIIKNGFPEDAKLVDIKYYPSNRIIELIIESNTYETIESEPIILSNIFK